MKNELRNKLEAILFLESEPVEKGELAENLGIEKNLCQKELQGLKNNYKENDSALDLVITEDKVQLVTRKKLATFIEKYYKRKNKTEQFSPAMLEVLSIVLYKTPIGKAGIEKIRGVDCGLMLRRLLIKGLIEKQEKTENSKTFIYKPSLKLLKKLGISRLEDLPEYDKLSNELKNKIASEQLVKK